MNLYNRINSISGNMLDKDHLHGLRFIGNDSIHEIKELKDIDIFDALDVFEFISSGIYVKKINRFKVEAPVWWK